MYNQTVALGLGSERNGGAPSTAERPPVNSLRETLENGPWNGRDPPRRRSRHRLLAQLDTMLDTRRRHTHNARPALSLRNYRNYSAITAYNYSAIAASPVPASLAALAPPLARLVAAALLPPFLAPAPAPDAFDRSLSLPVARDVLAIAFFSFLESSLAGAVLGTASAAPRAAGGGGAGACGTAPDTAPGSPSATLASFALPLSTDKCGVSFLAPKRAVVFASSFGEAGRHPGVPGPPAPGLLPSPPSRPGECSWRNSALDVRARLYLWGRGTVVSPCMQGGSSVAINGADRTHRCRAAPKAPSWAWAGCRASCRARGTIGRGWRSPSWSLSI